MKAHNKGHSAHLHASSAKPLVEDFNAQFQKDERKQCPLYSKYAKTLKINEVDMLTPAKSELDQIHLRNAPQSEMFHRKLH